MSHLCSMIGGGVAEVEVCMYFHVLGDFGNWCVLLTGHINGVCGAYSK